MIVSSFLSTICEPQRGFDRLVFQFIAHIQIAFQHLAVMFRKIFQDVPHTHFKTGALLRQILQIGILRQNLFRNPI